jgi:hypothetical protein
LVVDGRHSNSGRVDMIASVGKSATRHPRAAKSKAKLKDDVIVIERK